jgi:uncharacterized iron-regulated membrane protein
MTFRKVLFWLHLVAGVVAGTVILVMCVTGTLLTFQQSVLRIVERDQRFVSPPEPGAARLDVELLLAQVRLAVPDAAPTTLTLDSDPRAAATVALGTQGILFLDPYTGRVLGAGSVRARAFYRSVTNWHRWLAVEGEGRATARAVTGACNAAFLVVAVTGLYLWMPRQWSWRHVAPVMWFRGGLRGKARDFNWHNTVGLWCAPILIVLTATGMVISYPWATNLVYTLTGSPRPVAAAGGRGGGAARAGEPAAGQRGGRGGRGGEIAAGERGGRGRGGDAGTAERATPGGREGAESRAERPMGAEARPASMFARAEQQVPQWRTMIVRLPPRPGGPVAFSMSDRAHWNSFARSTLTLDGATGATIRWEPYADSSRGQKVRGWMRFAHTGELGGLAGEAFAGLASAGGALLVWTGVALALRRLAAWRARSRARAVVGQEVLRPAADL